MSEFTKAKGSSPDPAGECPCQGERTLAATDDRQPSEEKLLSERTLSDAIIQGLPGLFCLFDSSGTILRWNNNLEKFTRFEAAEPGRMSAFEIVAEEERDVARRAVAEAFERGHAEAEGRLLNKDGQRIPCVYNLTRVQFDGRPCTSAWPWISAHRKKRRPP